jgi:hypothetical protein
MPEPPPFPSPATKILTLAGVLVISLVALVYGYASAKTTRQKIAAFASDSVVATGVVTNWQITNLARSPEYWLDLKFKTQDGSTREASANVGKPVFDSHKIGGPVQVTYVKSKPEWFYVEHEVPSERQAVALDWMFRLGALASLLSAVGLFAKLFNTRGGGTPAYGSSIQQQSTTTSIRRVSREPGASFGTRSIGK